MEMNATSTVMAVSTATVNTSADETTVQLLENLIPALMKTFLVILVGYIMGATNLYPTEHAAAIGRLCGSLLLPVTVFNSMATLDVTPSAWTFLYAVLICKGGLFVLVLVGVIITDREKGFLGRAAIWAIFSTQSNDFALGLPIFQVLYGASHPEFISFLYIVAPVNLVLLNPVGFILMVYSKARKEGNPFSCSMVGGVLKQVATNPLVVLTFLGVLVRLILWDTTAADYDGYTDYVEPVLDVIATAFTGCALFSLGLLIVGKFKLLQHGSPLKPILFIMVKSVMLPVVLKLVLDLLSPDDSTLSTAGFLYGIIPTAAGVFTYCMQFGQSPDLVAVAMVIGTIASAPLMLGLGAMVAVATDPNFVVSTIQHVVPYFKLVPSLFSMIGSLFFVITSGIRWFSLHRDIRMFRVCMVTSGVMLIIGYAALFPCQVMLAAYADNSTAPELHETTVQTLFLVSYFATTCYRAMIAAVALITPLVLRRYLQTGQPPSPHELKKLMLGAHAAAFMFSTVAVLFVASMGALENDSCVSPFSKPTAATSITALSLTCIANVVGLIWYSKVRHRMTETEVSRGSIATVRRQAISMSSLSSLSFSSIATSTTADRGETHRGRKPGGSVLDLDHLANDDSEFGTPITVENGHRHHPRSSSGGASSVGGLRGPNNIHASLAVTSDLEDGAVDYYDGDEDFHDLGVAHPALRFGSPSTPADDILGLGSDADNDDDKSTSRRSSDVIVSAALEQQQKLERKRKKSTRISRSTRYLSRRLYNRRFSVFLYEACVCALGAVAIATDILDAKSDIVLFAVTLSLTLLTFSSGVVLAIALGFPMLDCRRTKQPKIRADLHRMTVKSMQVGLDMNF